MESRYKSIIELCKYYTTTGYPYFHPVCLKGLRASLRCHSFRWSCPNYYLSHIPYGFKKSKE